VGKIIIFGGTFEGRKISEFFAGIGRYVLVSVISQMGAEKLPESEYIKISVGRKKFSEIKKIIYNAELVIDATHPFAAEVSGNIKRACHSENIILHRVMRPEIRIEGALYFGLISEIIDYLNKNDGNALITTGSKNLAEYTKVKSYQSRLFIRVLPVPETIDRAKSLGFINIINGPGDRPCNTEENIFHIKNSKAKFIVAKESGAAGGLHEKINAARRIDTIPLILKRPHDIGITLDGLLEKLKEQY
jgi:precorrin-2 dehydrogenase/sirohydrochlorin ferrochelatase/precorrin-6A/cobalt-precorrin-6A reductase